MFNFKALWMASLLWAGHANASLMLSETTDFSNDFSAPTAITQPLAIGQNYISGAVDYLRGDFYDSFLINLSANTAITRILFQAFDINVADPSHRIAFGFISMLDDKQQAAGLNIFGDEVTAHLQDFSFDSVTTTAIAFDVNHRTFAALAGASYFDYMQDAWGLYSAQEGTSSYRWQYTFTVEAVQPVPAPASVLLLVCAMLGLVWQQRRAASQRAHERACETEHYTAG